MTPEAVTKAYLGALGNADYEALMSLFATDAIVVSPLYGEQAAAVFYRNLLQDSHRSELTFLDVFTNADTDKASLHFRYRWTMTDGTVVTFDCVDVFEFDDDHRITRLVIIYDTAQARPAFDQLQRVKTPPKRSSPD
jgi:ketosteroid isomerase-like protein